LSTSDVEGSRKFYSELFGWEAGEANPEFGGYFMFTRSGAPVAGGMGGMGDMAASNAWQIYLATNDAEATVKAAASGGAQIVGPPMAVADLGVQAALIDPTGAQVGMWEPHQFPGFTALNEHGAPSWFELLTKDYTRAIAFYQETFHWETSAVADDDNFRYTMQVDSASDSQLAGVMDASSFLPGGVPSHWSVYWEVEDVSAAVKTVQRLGGAVVAEPEDTPYGRLATCADPAGAQFKLRTGTS
jgi:predicted enzyme related to lactoylglutathione lyase